MRIIMAVFHTIEGVEDTAKALLDAGFTDDDIGIVVRDSQKGTVIADDLGREYASGATPHDATVMSRTTVWDRFPEGYHESILRENLHSTTERTHIHPEEMHAQPERTFEHREGMPEHREGMLKHREGTPENPEMMRGDAGIPWYQQYLDRGDILMVINAGERPDDASRIIREHHGDLYHNGRVRHVEPDMESTERVDIDEKRRRDEAA